MNNQNSIYERSRQLEWLLKKRLRSKSKSDEIYEPYYGDVTELNTCRLIMDSVGQDTLRQIAEDAIDLLETSVAIYEVNGDYAFGMFSSGWCQLMDTASRKLCKTDDNRIALDCGYWRCHENCWNDSAKAAIESGHSTDIHCVGGINLYGEPIYAGKDVVGAINIGYGMPPADPERLKELAEAFDIDFTQLKKQASSYDPRPQFLVDLAKKRLQTSASLIGEIVEKSMLQSELQKERERLNVTLQSIGDGVITTDNKGQVILINRIAEELTGWKQENAKGKPLHEVFHIVNEHSRKQCDNPVEKVLETNSIIGLANDTLLISKDVTERVIADSGAPIVDIEGHTIGVVLVFRDITQRIELEAELRHAHKMEAIGNLAGGIAHEFNNILGIIIGNTELGIDDLERWHPVSENLNEIKLASLRAKDVVKQLLSFSRKIDIKRKPINIRIIVRESLKLLRASLPSNIRISEKFSTEIDSVIADPTQIHQLLINLCNNAAYAMGDEGGSLTVELSNVVFDFEAASKHPDLKPGKYVRFSVSDTGYGIPTDILDRIFDPYFTTKDVNKGTGMGLAVVHGIVKSHEGAIKVESHINKGTAFHVYFPVSQERSQKVTIHEDVLPTGSESIFFVDDDPSIVKYSKQLLERLGYKVSATTDPEIVLETFRKNPNDYDLVISDMMMPNLTGDRLVSELLKIRLDIPTMLCTGHSDRIDENKATELGIKAFVMKPLGKAALAKTVRKVLDEAADIEK